MNPVAKTPPALRAGAAVSGTEHPEEGEGPSARLSKALPKNSGASKFKNSLSG